MFCKIFWPSRSRQTSLFVPLTAVVSTPLNTFVCKIKDGVVDWVTVRKGQISETGDMVEVFGNLQEGDTVALHGSEELENRSRVKPIAVSPTPEKSNGQTQS
jgi:hypothetical protein